MIQQENLAYSTITSIGTDGLIFIEGEQTVSLKIDLIPVELALHDLAYGLLLHIVYLTDVLRELLCFLELLIYQKSRGLKIEERGKDIDDTPWQYYLIRKILSVRF